MTSKNASKSTSKTAQLANLRTGKAPKMPPAEPTIEQSEAAATAASDAEVEQAQLRFAPPADIEALADGEGVIALDEVETEAPAEQATGASLLAAAGLTKQTTREALAAYHKSLKDLGPVRTRATTARTVASRLNRLLRGTEKWLDGTIEGNAVEQARGRIQSAQQALLLAAQMLETIPTTWRPNASAGKGKTAADKNAIIGKVCTLREKARAQFKDVLSAEEMDALTVVAVAGSTYVCKTPDGTKVFLPRGVLLPREMPADGAAEPAQDDAGDPSSPPESTPPDSTDDVLASSSSRGALPQGAALVLGAEAASTLIQPRTPPPCA